MKKIYFSLLMISAMFMAASCGNKSNSGEAPAEEKAEVKEVTFTDPAISYLSGIDLTSYFSAESLTQPGIWEDTNSSMYHLTTSVKLKLQKKINIEQDSSLSGFIYFYVKFCDKNGSKIAESESIYRDPDEISKMNEGTIITLEGTSSENEPFEEQMQKKLDKVEKIEVSISTMNIKFAETAE